MTPKDFISSNTRKTAALGALWAILAGNDDVAGTLGQVSEVLWHPQWSAGHRVGIVIAVLVVIFLRNAVDKVLARLDEIHGEWEIYDPDARSWTDLQLRRRTNPAEEPES